MESVTVTRSKVESMAVVVSVAEALIGPCCQGVAELDGVGDAGIRGGFAADVGELEFTGDRLGGGEGHPGGAGRGELGGVGSGEGGRLARVGADHVEGEFE